jgi:predicted molibdopterin-dependent oxidoreductase YjgC
MANELTVYVNGHALEVPAGATVAVAVLLAGEYCRISVSGQPRTPVCGMGTCFECRVEINGETQRRSCQLLCEAQMRIVCHG